MHFGAQIVFHFRVPGKKIGFEQPIVMFLLHIFWLEFLYNLYIFMGCVVGIVAMCVHIYLWIEGQRRNSQRASQMKRER